MHAPILVLHHRPVCHCTPNSTGTPPTHLLALCHPHQPPPSQIFVVSPVKTGTLSKIFRKFSTFDFLCTGPAPTTPAPPAHSARAPAPPAHPPAHLHAPFAHPSVHLHAPFAHPSMHLCAPFAHLPHTFCAPMCTLCSIFWVCHPYPTFFFNLRPPSGYHGQPSPSATGHSAHFRTSV